MRRFSIYLLFALTLVWSLAAFAGTGAVPGGANQETVPASDDPSMVGGTPVETQINELDEGYCALIKDLDSFWGNSNVEIMDQMPDVEYDIINSSDLADTDLSDYWWVLVESNQDGTFNQNVLDNMDLLEAYVNDGGWLQFHMGTNTHEPHLELWDGTTYIYQDMDNSNWVGEDGEGHPLLEGVNEPFQGNWANHGYLNVFPDEALEIVETTSGNSTLMEYDYGSGHVVVTTMTMEYLWDNDYNSGQILWNLIEYMAWHEPPGPVAIDFFAENPPVIVPPGGSFTYGLNVTSEWQGSIVALFWTEIEIPNGQVFGPLDWANVQIFFGMDLWVTNMVQNVSAAAPEGQYRYTLYAGLGFDTPLLDDYFYFEVDEDAPGADGTGDWSTQGLDQLGTAAAGDVGDRMSALPSAFSLNPVYPNPFNPTATVSVALPQTSELNVTVFNVMGRQVAQLATGSFGAGVHQFVLDGTGLTSGVYFVHATVPGELDAVEKVTLMK
ncbi:MAG: hypothetical protein MAG453_02003 [Calditrichaeota bacterium]|nr:hypothetical protein [Calditrichota bacterium]